MATTDIQIKVLEITVEHIRLQAGAEGFSIERSRLMAGEDPRGALIRNIATRLDILKVDLQDDNAVKFAIEGATFKYSG